jgi:drug/metabolite transporter (DMT)-like permease
VVASLAYVTVVLASLIAAIWWHEQLSLEAYMAIGLIVLSGLISMRSTR